MRMYGVSYWKKSSKGYVIEYKTLVASNVADVLKQLDVSPEDAISIVRL